MRVVPLCCCFMRLVPLFKYIAILKSQWLFRYVIVSWGLFHYYRYIATLTPLASQGLFYCPTCRKTHDLPTGGVPALQTNFVFNKMLEKLKVRKILSSFEVFVLFEEKLSCKTTRKRKDNFTVVFPSNEQVWTGLQWWPPNVTRRGSYPMSGGARAGGRSLYRDVPCLEGELGLGLGLGRGTVQWGPMHPEWWSHGTRPLVNRQTRLKTLPSRNFVGKHVLTKNKTLTKPNYQYMNARSTMTYNDKATSPACNTRDFLESTSLRRNLPEAVCADVSNRSRINEATLERAHLSICVCRRRESKQNKAAATTSHEQHTMSDV